MGMDVNFPEPRNPVRFAPAPPAEIGAKGVVDILAEEASDAETIGNCAKVARAIVKIFLAVQLIAKEIGNAIVSHMSAIADTFKILGVFKKIKTIVDNVMKKGGSPSEKAQRAFRTASASVGIPIAVMTGFKLAENFMLLKIGNITKAMGNIPVIGATLAALFPFSVVLSAFEIVESGFSIAATSLKLYEIDKKVERVKGKISEKWAAPITSEFAKERMAAIQAKVISSCDKGQTLVEDVNDADAVLGKALKKRDKKALALEAKKVDLAGRNKITQFFSLIKPKFQLKRAEKNLKAAGQAYNKACKAYTAEKGTFDQLKGKTERWEKIGEKLENNAITEEEKANLETFRTFKIEKWKTKAKNFTIEKVKEGIGLGTTIFLTLFLITSIALTLIFPPAGAIAMPLGAIIFLAVGGMIIAGGFATKHLLKFWKPNPVNGVNVPALA